MGTNLLGVRRRPRRTRPSLALLGPAFVAAIAYVDPGNVASNISAGAQFGYLLVWVVVAANLMAVLVQYLSAKLGLVTGESLPEALRKRLGKRTRLAFWAQAELVAVATDLAEVVGGAIALQLLFDLPLVVGGLVTGVVSMALLAVYDRGGSRRFERVIVGLLAVIAIGFLLGLVVEPPSATAAVSGLLPRFDGAESVLLAAAMLGATVMPHAIYLHSGLVRDRHGSARSESAGSETTEQTAKQRRPGELRRLLTATRFDVGFAMLLAGAVNLGMLLLAATTLQGLDGVDSIQGAHAAVADALGPLVALALAIGLLASGLASTSVGAYAGAMIMQGLLRKRVPLLLRRLVTLTPALVVLAAGVDPSRALVFSQVVLSFGIPFALVPLVRLTSDRAVMGAEANRRCTTVLAWLVAVVISALNLLLLYLTVS